MEDVLPKSAIWRPRAGFTAPRAWLVGSLCAAVAELLSPRLAAVSRALRAAGGAAAHRDGSISVIDAPSPAVLPHDVAVDVRASRFGAETTGVAR